MNTSESSFETVEDRAAPALTKTDKLVSLVEWRSSFGEIGIAYPCTDDFSVAHVQPEVGAIVVGALLPDDSWWSL
ncbi:hypothetical protein [Rhizobium etli]|uniref:Uncharacterized protein n=1 Tax=Rhizobium etli TaxID=29449 RepID=A0A7W7EJ45_RHIET|nr:hypothetical protein [Rhizobium etli]MBB4483536.1 hypothetical protein [Rhizobium etli]MBB4539360.1 hypothetical protein [Rhizobium etli]